MYVHQMTLLHEERKKYVDFAGPASLGIVACFDGIRTSNAGTNILEFMVRILYMFLLLSSVRASDYIDARFVFQPNFVSSCHNLSCLLFFRQKSNRTWSDATQCMHYRESWKC